MTGVRHRLSAGELNQCVKRASGELMDFNGKWGLKSSLLALLELLKKNRGPEAIFVTFEFLPNFP